MISIKEKAIFWIVLFAVLIAFLGAISDILLPFIVAILVAYFLDPAADKLEEWGMSRTSATATITGLFFIIVIGVAAIIFPVIYDQFSSLIEKMPGYIESFHKEYGPKIDKLVAVIANGSSQKAEQILADYSGQVLKTAGGLVTDILQSGVAAINIISLIFISPVVSFFILHDWDKMTAKIDSWFPRDNAKIIRQQLKLIDETLSGYIRGQSNVCLILATFYGIGLSLVGLEFGLFIGIATGFLAFLPYVGMFIGMAVGLVVAFFQYSGDMTSIGIVAAVYLVGQFIEGNFITPKLVGEKVGLHPVWIIFGLLAGGSLFGFVGVLVAIPVTAIIGVLSRFALQLYIDGNFYRSSKVKKKSIRKTTKKS